MTQLRENAKKMAPNNLIENKKITPAIAVKILKENGIEIAEKEAEKVLELIYFLAKLIVNQNFKL